MNEPAPQETQPTPGNVDAVRSRPLSSLRLPLLVLFLSAVVATNIFPLPLLPVLTGASAVGAAFALFLDRRLMLELLRWKCFQAAIAPFVGIVLYGLTDAALQAFAAVSLNGRTSLDPGNLPLIFSWLLDLRARVGDTGNVAVGVALAFVFAAGQELFFRGLVMTRLMIHAGHGLAVLISALLFALFYFFVLGTLAGLLAFPAGIVFGLFTLNSRSLVPSMLCHMSILLLAFWIRPDIGALVGL